MEGTRNEKVVILIAAYVIGFVTAYIAFGVTQLQRDVQLVQVPVVHTASVSDAATNDATRLTVSNEGLVLIAKSDETLLSLRVEDNSDMDGAHVALTDYSMSHNEEYAYFCEESTFNTETCKPFVYSVANNIVYPVKVNDEKTMFEVSGQKASWSPEGNLVTPLGTSQDPNSPWKL